MVSLNEVSKIHSKMTDLCNKVQDAQNLHEKAQDIPNLNPGNEAYKQHQQEIKELIAEAVNDLNELADKTDQLEKTSTDRDGNTTRKTLVNLPEAALSKPKNENVPEKP